MKNLISYAKRLTWTKYGLETIGLNEIIRMIKDGSSQLYEEGIGNYSLKDVTEAIRNQTDERKQNQMKAAFLPVVTFNGIWDGSKISQYSSFTALDFDHIHSEQERDILIDRLVNTPCVFSFFRTFKPFRMKAIVLHDNADPINHYDMYGQLVRFFGISMLDEHCKDLSRRSFLPWDDEIWVNPAPVPFHYIPSPSTANAITQSGTSEAKQYIRSNSKRKSPHSIINILNSSWHRNHPEFWQTGNRAISIFKCACQFCEYGVPQDMADGYFVKHWKDNDMSEQEIIGHVRGAYRSTKYDSRCFY